MSVRYLMASASTALAIVAGLTALAGGLAAAMESMWIQLFLLATITSAALASMRDPHWSACLGLVGAAYARLPLRAAFGVEIPPIEALIPLPLWWEILAEQRTRVRWRLVAQVAAVVSVAVAVSASGMPRGAHWYATAPLVAIALSWIVVRDLGLGRRGVPAVCAAALALPCLHVILELSFPVYPALQLAPIVNVWLAVLAATVAVQRARGSRKWIAMD